MTVAEAIGAALAARGVRHVFGVVGSGNFAVTSALVAGGTRFVAARHETSAVAMADAYARLTRGVGLASVHQGPGFTNAITGLTEASKAHSPVLLLAADTPAAWVDSNFLVNQAAIAAGAGIAVERISSPESAAADLQRAWRCVTEGQATVLLLPLDVQTAALDEPIALAAEPYIAPPAPGAEVIGQLADLVAAAERPVIVGGRGAVLAGAREALEELGERIGALLATSLNANGLFAGSAYAVGVSGGFATPLAAELIAQADLVLGFGASLNRWTTRHGRLIGPRARVVQVDVVGSRLGSRLPIALGVAADARLAAEALTHALAGHGIRGDGFRTDGLAERIAASGWRAQTFRDASTPERIDPRRFTLALDELLPVERTVTVDGGHFSGWPTMYLSVPDADGFIFNQAFQSIGLGLGTGIGAAVARPDRLVVCTVGDGGAFMALGELETAARLGLPMIICVYNDDAYGAEVHHFAPHGYPLDVVRFGERDLAAIGRAAGAEGIAARSTDDLAGVARWLEGPRNRPLVVDARVVPEVVGDWLPEAFRA